MKQGSARRHLAPVHSEPQCNTEDARQTELHPLSPTFQSLSFLICKTDLTSHSCGVGRFWSGEREGYISDFWKSPACWASIIQPQLFLPGRCSQLRIICCLNSAWVSAPSSREIKFYFSWLHLHPPSQLAAVWSEANAGTLWFSDPQEGAIHLGKLKTHALLSLQALDSTRLAVSMWLLWVAPQLLGHWDKVSGWCSLLRYSLNFIWRN